MIRAQLLAEDGRVWGFHISGHAGWGEDGTDIVCAAVSSAAYLVVNTATEVLGIVPWRLRVGEGEMMFLLRPWDEPRCRDILRGLRLQLLGLMEQYPEHIEVSARKVSYHNILRKEGNNNA